MHPLNPTPVPLLENSVLDSRLFDPAYLFNRMYDGSYHLYLYVTSGTFRELLMNFVFFLSLFFITLICYCAVRLFEIRKKEHHHVEHEIAEYAHHQQEREKKAKQGDGISKNTRWVQVLEYLFSQNPNDWKLSIIEADSMLEVLMDQLGFQGVSLGDKLKMARQANFRGIDMAWEVHTIRNRIAHEGAAFNLSQHEAKRVVALYEQIFRQFGYI